MCHAYFVLLTCRALTADAPGNPYQLAEEEKVCVSIEYYKNKNEQLNSFSTARVVLVLRKEESQEDSSEDEQGREVPISFVRSVVVS